MKIFGRELVKQKFERVQKKKFFLGVVIDRDLSFD